MRLATIAPAALLAAVLAASAHAEDAQKAEAGASSNEPPFSLTDPARIAAGKSRFDSTCAAFCHGDNPALFIGRTDLERHYVYNTIRDGGKGATPMPPWGEVFSAPEIWELVAYVQSLGTPPDR